ncbi:cupin domain-containing protein [Halobacteriales archaeon QH_2_65_14]|nr:MAG: cupin domain-containing protein [Halobacteriales archaeon QH_2_65_14]
MTALKTVSLDDLELVEVTQAGTEMDVNVNFPFSPEFPATSGVELEGGHNVVYFEIEPGKELGTHRDSPEELIICLEGDSIEAWAGDAKGTIGAGDLEVIPPLAPHGFHNRGDVTARFLGIFSDSSLVAEFEETLEPFGDRFVKA